MERPEFEKAIGRRLTDPMWNFAQHDGLVEDFECGRLLRDDVRASLDEIFSVESRATVRQRRPTTSVSETLSSVIASHASQRQDVVALREELLDDGGLIPYDDHIGEWLHARRQRCPIIGTDGVYLSFGNRNSRHVERIPVGAETVLSRLHYVARDLADDYDWQPAMATVFVLTGVTPLRRPIRVDRKASYDYPLSGRIVLEVDPWTEPHDVANAYQRERTSMLAARRPGTGTSRVRAMEEKGLRLAEFYAKHVAVNKTETWDTLRARWNRKWPKYKYADWREFQNASNGAYKQLTERFAF
jgi:hypothetical protein